MASIRVSAEHWTKTYAHLFTEPGEHFAFFLAASTQSRRRPVFVVKDVLLINDADVEITRSGWVMSNNAVTNIINAAVKTGGSLIEIHNHGGVLPRFSGTDRVGLAEFVPYVLDSLRGRPYAATVWGDDTIYAEYFMPDGKTGVIDSVVVYGDRLDQRVSRDDDEQEVDERFDRQAPWFTPIGQRKLGRMRFGIVGLGGTGSPLAQNLVYLGGRDFLLVEHDASDKTSMNRLVTATAADIGTPKAILARRLIKAVAPDAKVEIIEKRVETAEALDALKGVDVLLGCVDNDGARVVLNELALAYRIPYFDLAVGIDAEEGRVEAAGGRLAAVLPNGPCLYCMNQIDADEARYWLSSDEQRDFMRKQGYVRGLAVQAPSVAALNASLAASAASELAVYFSGLRPIAPLSELDILGAGRALKAQWLTPVRMSRMPGCPVCESGGIGGAANIERYSRD